MATASKHLPAVGRAARTRLTDAQFYALAEVPPELEWFANLTNPHTRRAYVNDVRDFQAFVGIARPEEFRIVTRAHFIAWRKSLSDRNLAAATIRRKLSALSSLFDYLCEQNAISHNVVDGVKRPTEGANEGKTPAAGDEQAKALLNAPDPTTLKGQRDRAILAVFLFHGLRCSELCGLRVKDLHERRGVKHLRVQGKRNKVRFLPAHPAAIERIQSYLLRAGHIDDGPGPMFRPVVNSRGTLEKSLTTASIYHCVVKKYALQAGINIDGFCTHSLRATAATNALENQADIAKVQEWLGHSSIATTRLYDKRATRPEDSPTFKVSY
jgi:integrase/recombinase XerD